MPSRVPSKVPSLTPSRAPSTVPSLTPSRVPSTVPSLNLSAVPSLAPSSVPSSAVISNAYDAVNSFLCNTPTLRTAVEGTYGPIASWTFAASVTSFEGLFDKARVGNNCADADYQAFNEDISGWKLPGVQSMATMFQDATSFNQDISSWDVGEVTTMDSMFRGSTAFNSPIFTSTAKVTTMESMFRGATSFNQDVSSMSVGEVTTMAYMFYGADQLQQSHLYEYCQGDFYALYVP